MNHRDFENLPVEALQYIKLLETELEKRSKLLLERVQEEKERLGRLEDARIVLMSENLPVSPEITLRITTLRQILRELEKLNGDLHSL